MVAEAARLRGAAARARGSRSIREAAARPACRNAGRRRRRPVARRARRDRPGRATTRGRATGSRPRGDDPSRRRPRERAGRREGCRGRRSRWRETIERRLDYADGVIALGFPWFWMSSSAPEGLTPASSAALRARQAERLPSIAAAVVRDGETVWSGAVGMADLEAGIEAGPETQYRVGSITKTFTAVAVMQLRDAGELDLDDRVEQHIPGIANGSPTLAPHVGAPLRPAAGGGGDVRHG